jgi:hypothetical protein
MIEFHSGKQNFKLSDNNFRLKINEKLSEKLNNNDPFSNINYVNEI